MNPSIHEADRAAVKEAAAFLRERLPGIPDLAMVLGSGFGPVAEEVTEKIRIPYAEIPGFLPSTVVGHTSEIICGRMHGRLAMILSGRKHFYEGYSAFQITFPVRALKALGVETLVLTAAAGSMRKEIKPGALVALTDHMNFTGDNPLRGFPRSEPGEFFPDMSDAYSPELLRLAEKAAKAARVRLHKGIYAGYAGPSYETPAEIRGFRQLGCHVVGMSTVSEVIMAKRIGVKVLAIICASNYAAGITKEKLAHHDVLAKIKESMGDMQRLLARLIPALPQRQRSERAPARPEVAGAV